jgi:Rrf2 family protein
MQLNVSTCYAMQIMVYLARSKLVVPSTELAENLKISQRYILQLTGKLRDGGLTRTRAGPSGGISLNMGVSQISAYDVITIMEGDMSIPKCVTQIPGCGEPCLNTNLFDTLSIMKEYLDTYLKTITLDKLADMNINGHLSDILELVINHIDEIRYKNNP